MERGDIEMKSGAREVIIEATAHGSRNLAYLRKPRLEVRRLPTGFDVAGLLLTLFDF